MNNIQFISSNQNEKFKYLKKLKQKKYRIIEDKIIIEGKRFINHAILQGIEPTMICYSADSEITPLRYDKNDISLEPALFRQLSDTVNSQGIIAVISNLDIEKKLNPSSEHIVVINGVQDPGNLGTIIRSADAFGFDKIILSKNTCDPYSAKSLRSSMGGIFNVSLKIGMKSEDIINYLKRDGYQIVVSSLEAKKDIKEISLNQKSAIVFGSEANGVDEKFIENADVLYKISMRESAESLNVAVACSLTLNHFKALS